MKTKKEEAQKWKKLKKFGAVIQICDGCGKVDAYKNDGHNCGQEILRQEAWEHYK